MNDVLKENAEINSKITLEEFLEKYCNRDKTSIEIIEPNEDI